MFLQISSCFFFASEVEMKPKANAKKLINNAKYCKAYRQKNLAGIRKKDKKRKFQREYKKYCEPKK